MNLFPSEVINNGIEAYLARHSIKPQWIYWIVLAAITGTIIVFPFIYIDLSVQDTGIVRPVGEKAEIKSTVTEYVDSIFIKEGSKINRGDTILTLRSLAPDYKINYQQGRLTDLTEHINDLRYLARNVKPATFHSDTRRQEYLHFIRQKTEYETAATKTEKDMERNRILFEKNVISAEEYESYQYEYDKATNQLASFTDNQLSKWQTELNSYLNMYGEINSNLNLDSKEKDFYAITSPINGTVEQFRGIYRGSNIQAGTTLAIISPDSSLYVEVYVQPRNIGYIHTGMAVHLQVEAFNYNEWGALPGKVIEVSSDFFMDESGRTIYKVKCSLDKGFLQHKKGMKGFIKKGMTVSAHFMITRRSLLDILYLKMDNWMNPAQYNSKNK